MFDISASYRVSTILHFSAQCPGLWMVARLKEPCFDTDLIAFVLKIKLF